MCLLNARIALMSLKYCKFVTRFLDKFNVIKDSKVVKIVNMNNVANTNIQVCKVNKLL